MLIWPVQSLGWIIANGQEAATAADRIQEVLDSPPAIVDAPHAVALPRCAVRGRLRFENVTFRYPGTAEPVLRGIDLTVEPGETIAVVGATGSGKSTLLSLVPRLHDVDRRAGSPSTGTTCATCGWPRCAGWSRWPSRNRRCSPCRCGRTSPWVAPTPARTRCGRRSSWPGPSSRTTCRGACGPGWASRVCRSPEVSGSGWRWPGRCSSGPRCSCSTIRSPRSTCTPRRRWSRR